MSSRRRVALAPPCEGEDDGLAVRLAMATSNSVRVAQATSRRSHCFLLRVAGRARLFARAAVPVLSAPAYAHADGGLEEAFRYFGGVPHELLSRPLSDGI
jgi:hypothetical protein